MLVTEHKEVLVVVAAAGRLANVRRERKREEEWEQVEVYIALREERGEREKYRCEVG